MKTTTISDTALRAAIRSAEELIDQCKYEEAAAALREIASSGISSPLMAKINALIGYCSYQREEYDQAIQWFTAAIALKPNVPNTLFLRGRSYEELERFREAIKDYDRTLAMRPDTEDAYAQKGFCLEQLGLYDEAVEAYNSALALDPEESLALEGLKVIGRRDP